MTERITLKDAAEAYIEHLRQQGKKERTLYTYKKDLEVLETFFGAEKSLAAIRAPQVGKFLKSDLLLKLPSGKDRARPTVAKTVRVLRMFLLWAKEAGHIDEAPLPKDVPLGHSRPKGETDAQ